MQIEVEPFEARSVRGREVIAVGEGKIVGRVRELIFDPMEHRLLGLLVRRGRGGQTLFLPASAVLRLGPRAVTTDREANLDSLDAHPHEDGIVTSGVRFEGAPVMLQDGARIATVRDIWMNSGLSVNRYDAVYGVFPFERRLHISPDQVVIVGPDAMVLEADPRPSVPEPAG